MQVEHSYALFLINDNKRGSTWLTSRYHSLPTVTPELRFEAFLMLPKYFALSPGPVPSSMRRSLNDIYVAVEKGITH